MGKATSYLETVPNSYYVLTSKAPLVKPRRPGAKDAGAIVRQLEEGEIFIADGPPQKASPKPPNLTSNVRTLNDNIVGWVTWPKQGKSPLQTLEGYVHTYV